MRNTTPTQSSLPALFEGSSERTVAPAFAERIESAIEILDRAGLPARYVNNRPVPRGVESVFTDDRDWAVCRWQDDPAVRRERRFYMPPRVHGELLRVRDAGVRFDELVVAHELPAGTLTPGQPINHELLLPPRREVVVHTGTRLADAATTVNRFTLGLLRGTTIAAATAAVASSKVVGHLLEHGLDPVIFGLLTDETQEDAAWFYLTHWVWGQERG